LFSAPRQQNLEAVAGKRRFIILRRDDFGVFRNYHLMIKDGKNK